MKPQIHFWRHYIRHFYLLMITGIFSCGFMFFVSLHIALFLLLIYITCDNMPFSSCSCFSFHFTLFLFSLDFPHKLYTVPMCCTFFLFFTCLHFFSFFWWPRLYLFTCFYIFMRKCGKKLKERRKVEIQELTEWT